MKDYNIEDLDLKKLTYEDYEKMPAHVVDRISIMKANEEIKEAEKKIDYEPRDWFQNIDKMWICGVMGETIYAIKHSRIRTDGDTVYITGWESGNEFDFETFKTREKLESFIDALQVAKNNVFGS